MSGVFEALMLVCFGLSWPINAIKAWTLRSAKGTNWNFLALITVGYLFGIAAKFCGGTINWVLAVYLLNLVCVGANWAIFFRNRRLDAQADHEDYLKAQRRLNGEDAKR